MSEPTGDPTAGAAGDVRGVSVRRVRAEDWRAVRALRLEALHDPAAPLAFLESYDDAVARPDSFWQERVANAAAGRAAAQFVGITDDGRWVASVVGLREEPGTHDWGGRPITRLQVQVVGVYVAPDQRGAGLLGRLVDAVRAWAAEHGVDRLRLHVHEHNDRAQAAYRKLGFTFTGARLEIDAGTELEMVLTGPAAPTEVSR